MRQRVRSWHRTRLWRRWSSSTEQAGRQHQGAAVLAALVCRRAQIAHMPAGGTGCSKRSAPLRSWDYQALLVQDVQRSRALPGSEQAQAQPAAAAALAGRAAASNSSASGTPRMAVPPIRYPVRRPPDTECAG